MDQQAKQKISEIVGHFCETRVPPHAQDQIKMLYRISGNDVIIVESRPYWQRANGRWLKYPDFSPTKNLAELISEIDADPNHVFWG